MVSLFASTVTVVLVAVVALALNDAGVLAAIVPPPRRRGALMPDSVNCTALASNASCLAAPECEWCSGIDTKGCYDWREQKCCELSGYMPPISGQCCAATGSLQMCPAGKFCCGVVRTVCCDEGQVCNSAGQINHCDAPAPTTAPDVTSCDAYTGYMQCTVYNAGCNWCSSQFNPNGPGVCFTSGLQQCCPSTGAIADQHDTCCRVPEGSSASWQAVCNAGTTCCGPFCCNATQQCVNGTRCELH